MIYDLQKASILKRISAWLLDAILLVVLLVGVACALSTLIHYDDQVEQLQVYYDAYEEEYGVDFDITTEDYEAMSAEEQARFQEAEEAVLADEQVMLLYQQIVSQCMLIVMLSTLISYAVLEFAVPLLFKNGQTIGKKVFAIGLMRTGGTRVEGVCIFIRAILGKCAVETMLPVFVVVWTLFGMMSAELLQIGLVAILALAAVQLVLLFSKGTRVLHDRMADTVAVDLASQMIFDTPQELEAYKQRVAAEQVNNDPYC